MFQVLDDTAHLSAKELLSLTSKEAALLEALRGLFEAIEFPKPPKDSFSQVGQFTVDLQTFDGLPATIPREKHYLFLRAKEVYLELRDLSHAGPKL